MEQIRSTLSGAMPAPWMDSSGAARQAASTSSEKAKRNVKKVNAGKKAILVVSFGTSYKNTREATIGAIEKCLKEKFPDYDERRAFTSRTIINTLKKRDNIRIDNVDGAMKSLIKDGVGTLVVQPTHVISGYEYDEMRATVNTYEDHFKSLSIGYPLLNSVDDYSNVVKALAADIPQIKDRKTAVILVGHGTGHFANSAYAALDFRFKRMGYQNVFVGTVESYPDIDCVMKEVSEYGVKKVLIVPFMVVAGDHAANDICTEKDGSWKAEFQRHGFEVDTLTKGLGEYANIREIYTEHVKDAIDGLAVQGGC